MIQGCCHTSGAGRTPALVLALAVSLALGGCYTLLRHPAAEGPTDARSDEACYRCHSEDDQLDPDIYPWVEYYSSSSSPWINYYGAPWWYDSQWVRQPVPGEPEADESQRLPSGRHGWGRHARTLAGGDSLRSRDSLLPPSPIVSSPSPAPSIPSVPAQGQSGGSQGSTDDKKKKEEKEPKRRALRR